MWTDLVTWGSNLFGSVQQSLFESLVQPLLFALGGATYLEDAFDATGWLLMGVLQIAVLLAVVLPLERLRPVEPMTDRRAVRDDIVYTLIHRLGLFSVIVFFAIDPLWDLLFGNLRMQGIPTFQLDEIWPGVTDVAWVSLVMYLLVFDFVDYWVHRGQHSLHWWWALHSLHHSQRQMTMWSDNRNHLLDDLLRDSAIALTARLIGVAPGQFILIVVATQLLQSLSHANVRLPFGPFERVVVSPRFHRVHHSIGIGHETSGKGTLGGHNFAVLFPIWDVIFGTANFKAPLDATGIRDQLPEEGGRDYGRGFWRQQWMGLQRLVARR
jgi:sterol desaturase/sphingolipid hydroxylase (fatty acid hydroxylase superfamily)